MLPKVTLAEPKAPYGVTTYHLPLDCAFQGEQGPLIFTLYEGLMWEKGTRTMLVDPLTYSFTDEDILIWGGASEYVQYASRVPDSGDLVEVIRSSEQDDDVWLVVAEGELPEFGALGDGIALMDAGGGAALLEALQVPQPFMEKRARSLVQAEGELAFYSLGDLETWMAQMPKIGLMAGIVLGMVVLWAFSGPLARRARENRGILTLNAGIGALALAAAAVLLAAIQLPASLLPETTIVDFGAYAAKFGELSGALAGLAKNGAPAAAEALGTMRMGMFIGCAGAMGVPLLMAIWGYMGLRVKDNFKSLLVGKLAKT